MAPPSRTKPDPKKKPGTVEDADTDIIRQIASGHPEKFQELVVRYDRSLYRFGLRLCGEAQDAQDMVQEAFLNAFRYIGSFRHETRFKNWLYKIAANVCFKKRKKQKNTADETLSLDELLKKQGETAPDQTPEWAKAPLERLLNRELSRHLKQAIVSLPENHRMVVVLRDLEGFSTQETAQILGITEANVKVRLHRARLQLRQELGDYFRGTDDR